MTPCRCAPVAARSFVSVRDGVVDGRSRVLVDPVEVGRNDDMRLVLLRCACGRLWAESWWAMGHMDITFVFPVPDGVDPHELLARGDDLKPDSSGPLGRP